MGTYSASIEKELPAQSDLAKRRERCSADPERLGTIGCAAGHQVRVVRSATQYALYTVSEVLQETPDTIVRMGKDGRQRLGIAAAVAGTIDSQITHPTYTDAQAQANSEFVERLDDNGTHSGLIVIAPHGGAIEASTDTQAERVAAQLAAKGVSCWRCTGWKSGGGAFDRWHITSTDISPVSFRLLGTVISRGFTYAVAFHGWSGADILIGGAAPDALKQEIKTAIDAAVAGSGIAVRVAAAGEDFEGGSPKNIVNRLTAGGGNGVQIEQSSAARSGYGQAIADAVAATFSTKLSGLAPPAPAGRGR
jgi:phage replication-related protein YjqB (UPF0714/DUF867 family)